MSLDTNTETLDATQASRLSDEANLRLRKIDLAIEYADVINAAIRQVAEQGKRRHVLLSEIGIDLGEYRDSQIRELRSYLIRKQYRVRERKTSQNGNGENFDLAISWE